MTQLIRRLALAAIILVSSFTHAKESCPQAQNHRSVDMRSQFGALRDQDSIGWCYAFGSSDQMTHWMVQHRVPGVGWAPGNRASAAAIAYDYNAQGRGKALSRVGDAIARAHTAENRLEQATLQQAEAQGQVLRLAASRARDDSTMRDLLQKYNNGNSDSEQYHFRSLLFARCWATVPGCRGPVEAAAQAEVLWSRALLKIEDSAYEEAEGGWAQNALQKAIDGGICSEGDVPSEDQSGASALSLSLETSRAMGRYLLDPSDENFCPLEENIHSQFPRFGGDIKSVIDNYQNEDPISVFMRSCRRTSLPAPPPLVVNLENMPDGELFRRVDTVLDQPNPVPVGISYNPSFFNYSGAGAPVEPENTSHYSLLVGKQFNCTTGEEEYLLRNSWGKDSCASNRSSFRSLSYTDPAMKQIEDARHACFSRCPSEQPQKTPVDPGPSVCDERCSDQYHEAYIAANHPPYRCTDDGYYIVPRSTLERATTSVTYLE